MISDAATNALYISDLLAHQHPAIASSLKATFGACLRTIPGTKDIWCRDFMPIQLAPDRFVQFHFDPDYLKAHTDLRTDDGASLLDLECVRSDLVIDGGNVVRCGNTAIVTNKIFRENPGMEHRWLRDELRRILELEWLVIIPKEPGDIFCHSDGMVRFVDERTVLVNDYGKTDPVFGKRLRKALDGFEVISFPYAPVARGIWGVDPAIGVYINFLHVTDTMICPTFGLPDDDQALKVLGRCFPKVNIIPVRCNELAMGGGVLNCVTWNIKTERRPKCR